MTPSAGGFSFEPNARLYTTRQTDPRTGLSVEQTTPHIDFVEGNPNDAYSGGAESASSRIARGIAWSKYQNIISDIQRLSYARKLTTREIDYLNEHAAPIAFFHGFPMPWR